MKIRINYLKVAWLSLFFTFIFSRIVFVNLQNSSVRFLGLADATPHVVCWVLMALGLLGFILLLNRHKKRKKDAS